MGKLSEMVYYNPKYSEPKIYSKIYDSNGRNKTKLITNRYGMSKHEKELMKPLLVFPKLYTEVRKYVSNKWGKTDDGLVYDTAAIINEIGKNHGYDFKAKGTILSGLYGASGIKSIKKYNLPFAFCVSVASNAGYGNYIMAGCGYELYTKTSGWVDIQNNRE